VPSEDPDALAAAIVRGLQSARDAEGAPPRRFDWADSVAALEAVLKSVVDRNTSSKIRDKHGG
jgi:hypothetical protein